MDQVTMPKAAIDALMQQISALHAKAARFTATIEEKDRIIAEIHLAARCAEKQDARPFQVWD